MNSSVADSSARCRSVRAVGSRPLEYLSLQRGIDPAAPVGGAAAIRIADPRQVPDPRDHQFRCRAGQSPPVQQRTPPNNRYVHIVDRMPRSVEQMELGRPDSACPNRRMTGWPTRRAHPRVTGTRRLHPLMPAAPGTATPCCGARRCRARGPEAGKRAAGSCRVRIPGSRRRSGWRRGRRSDPILRGR